MNTLHSLAKFKEILKNPPPSSRGLTRWWWYGCAATRKEITRELEYMKEAGLGGVELQILYPLSEDNKDKNIRNIPYFSPEFFDIIEFTANKCREMGMRFDFTLGSSWPYGGPFVPQEFAMQCAIPYQIDLKGPQVYSEDITNQFVGDVVVASIGKMENSVMLPETVRDISDKFADRHLFGWVWGKKIEPIEIPEGDWKLCFFVIHRYRQSVLKPAPGAEGLVIDHCSREALDCFLENMAQPIVDRLGKGAIDSFFCDSIECDGQNWSGKLLEEFERRRGYDLGKYIYALWGDMGEITPHVRYDYFLTMSEMTLENFFEPLTQWCNKNGSMSRIQAHGTWGDILRAYAAADQPEGETFGDHRTLECNSIHRRMAASAGHLYGKNIISNETFTWLGNPRFTETLEGMKASVDGVFLDGINQIVNHGYSLTHEGLDSPGWCFYASSHISHTNTWWPYYKHLGKYIHKVSAFLQLGNPHVEVGIYLPQADVWADNRLSDVHMAMRLEDRIGRELADGINKAGYWFDYLNDHALTELAVPCQGGIRIQDNVYRVILLINCHRLPPETAETLEAFVESGGILICVGGVPNDSCGLMNRGERRSKVVSAMDRIFADKKDRIVSYCQQEIVSALRREIDPDVDIEKSQKVGYVHRRDGNDHIYFIANISPEPVRTRIAFKDRTGGCFVLPTEGEEKLAPVDFKTSVSPLGRPRAEVVLDLEAYQSVFVIFPDGMDISETELAPERSSPVFVYQLKGWEFFVPGREEKAFFQTPETWETISGLEYYSGEGVYRTFFKYEKRYDRVCIRLQRLYCAATVYINGQDAGDIWKAPYVLDITKYLRLGENTIELKVVNTLFNQVINPEGGLKKQELPVVIDEWPYFGNIMNNIYKDKQPIGIGCDDSELVPMPSGILGDVVLEMFD